MLPFERKASASCSEWPDKLIRVASITASARLEELVPASYKREEAEAAGAPASKTRRRSIAGRGFFGGP
jgi:hypothetical protein